MTPSKAARVIHILSDRNNRDPRFLASIMEKLLVPKLHKQFEWLCFAYYRGAFYHEFEVGSHTLFVRRRNSKHGTRRFSYMNDRRP